MIFVNNKLDVLRFGTFQEGRRTRRRLFTSVILATRRTRRISTSFSRRILAFPITAIPSSQKIRVKSGLGSATISEAAPPPARPWHRASPSPFWDFLICFKNNRSYENQIFEILNYIETIAGSRCFSGAGGSSASGHCWRVQRFFLLHMLSWF